MPLSLRHLDSHLADDNLNVTSIVVENLLSDPVPPLGGFLTHPILYVVHMVW